MRGYYGIGVYHPKHEVNIGTLWRSAREFGAAFLFTIGRRYNTQTKAGRHIPLHHYDSFDDFLNHRPDGSLLVGIEQTEGARALEGFCHPPQALYLLGAEDDGLPAWVLKACNVVVQIDTARSLNVAVAGSIVMYSRERSWHTRTVAKLEGGTQCSAACKHGGRDVL